MVEARTTENMDLGGHEPGYKWAAGETPPNDADPGKWIVRLTNVWVVKFLSLPAKVEYAIQAFSPDDDGERAAKTMANKLVDNAWESYRNDPRRRNKTEEVIW